MTVFRVHLRFETDEGSQSHSHTTTAPTPDEARKKAKAHVVNVLHGRNVVTTKVKILREK